MIGMNGRHHGGNNAPPDPPVPEHGGPDPPSPTLMHDTESPTTTFTFQAKIDVNRKRDDKTPLRIKALLVALLIQHQRVDPTFHFLPNDDKSTAGAITKANEIPNTESKIKNYVKEMQEIDHRNNNKTYTVVFYVKVASSMTLGTMKKDNGLFMWLRNNNIWIRSYNFTTTYDVVSAGFISHMNASLHHRDRVNEAIQEAMKTNYPHLEIQLVPTTIKHGLDANNKRITHVVSCQADRQHLQKSREALVHVFKLTADKLPKDIFFVPSPVNGAISYKLYFDLVNNHHEHMANIRSFAVSGIADLETKMMAQDNEDVNSAVETSFSDIIMNAKVPGTNKLIFSSIEPTNASSTEGRYLLLTERNKMGDAEHMIDEFIAYIKANPEISNTLSIEGEEVRRANRIQTSNEFNGYKSFLLSKVPSTITTNPAPNAWNKRRDTTSMDYINDNYPVLEPSKKARFELADTITTTESTEQSDTVIVDLEEELKKERAHTEQRLSDLHKALADEIEKMKVAFEKQINDSIAQSEKRMVAAIQQHIGDIMRTSDNAIKRIEEKSNEVADRLLSIIKENHTAATGNTETSPPRKQQRRQNEDDAMNDSEEHNITPNTQASPKSLTKSGKDKSAGEKT